MATRRRARPRDAPVVARCSARSRRWSAARRRSSTITSRPTRSKASLDVIADACARGRRAGGVRLRSDRSPRRRTGRGAGCSRTSGSCAPAGAGMVGVHAAFTCSRRDARGGGGVGRRSRGRRAHPCRRGRRRPRGVGRDSPSSRPIDWLLVHAVHLDGDLSGTIAHNPRSNMNNAVGYARPAERPNPVVLGTDGIGADMLDEFRARVRAAPGGRRDGHRPRRRGRGSATAGSSCPKPGAMSCGGHTTRWTRGASRTRPACGRSTWRSTARSVLRDGAADARRRRRGAGQGRRAGPRLHRLL